MSPDRLGAPNFICLVYSLAQRNPSVLTSVTDAIGLSYRVFSVGTNDVIAFYPGGNESVHPYIKRVAGMPGDTLQIENGILLINGFPAAGQANDDLFEDAGVLESPLSLGEHEYFVLGDNHNNSEDSRNAGIGVVKSEYIIGKVWLVLDADSGHIGIVK